MVFFQKLLNKRRAGKNQKVNIVQRSKRKCCENNTFSFCNQKSNIVKVTPSPTLTVHAVALIEMFHAKRDQKQKDCGFSVCGWYQHFIDEGTASGHRLGYKTAWWFFAWKGTGNTRKKEMLCNCQHQQTHAERDLIWPLLKMGL